MLGRLATAVALLALGLAVGAAAGLAADWYLRQEALADAFSRLRLFQELRRAALEDSLESTASDVRAASESPRVVEALEKLTFAWGTFNTEARRTLQRLYIEENPHPQGERSALVDADDGSYYSAYHGDFHGWAKAFREHFGYYDVFLISARGDIIYSVAKEKDFATNLKTGPYRASPLGQVFRRAVSAAAEEVDFSDFAPYPPSNDEAAAFAAHPVRKDGALLGVLAVQIPSEPLNELMHFTQGMGKTGETYLVGTDGLMRSQSRFSSEPTLLATRVANPSVSDALAGRSGARIVPDYRGVPVLSVYSPIDFGGQKWALLAEIDEVEVLRQRSAGFVIIAALLAGLAAIALGLLAHQFTAAGNSHRRELDSRASA